MSSSRILLILTIASLSLLLISGLAAVRDQIALARGGKALHQVLAQQSSASGSLPIWMLGRSVKSAGPETQAAIELAVDQRFVELISEVGADAFVLSLWFKV